jgi:hypothetical protein
VKCALAPLVNYERGMAFEEAGDRRAAAFRLERFVDAYDQPPVAHRGLVDNAKRRLSQLRATDAPPSRSVAPH